MFDSKEFICPNYILEAEGNNNIAFIDSSLNISTPIEMFAIIKTNSNLTITNFTLDSANITITMVNSASFWSVYSSDTTISDLTIKSKEIILFKISN